MKHDGPKGPRKRRPVQPEPAPDAFGAWLSRSLRQQFAAVLHEPTPQSLLDIIEADRATRAVPPLHPEPPRPARRGAGKPEESEP